MYFFSAMLDRAELLAEVFDTIDVRNEGRIRWEVGRETLVLQHRLSFELAVDSFFIICFVM